MADSDKKKAQKVINRQVDLLATFVQLESEVRAVESIEEFSFVVVNDTKRLINYDTAVLWRFTADKNVKVQSVSGVPDLERDAPLVTWCRDVLKAAQKQEWRLETRVLSVSEAEASGIDKDTARTWLGIAPPHIIYCPLISPKGALLGGLLLMSESEWENNEPGLLQKLSNSYAHSWWALLKHTPQKRQWLEKMRSKRVMLTILALLFVAMFLPIRLSALAPAQVIPKKPFIVSSPLDGVLKEFHIVPNKNVEEGEVLFSLDDTKIRSNYDVAQQALNVAKAEYRKTAQQAFTDLESKARLAVLTSEIERRKAELAFNEEILEKINVRAERAGIAVYDNPNEWVGKPLVVGERVMQIADYSQVQLEVFVPVDDAIALSNDTEVRLFLNVDPLNPVTAVLTYASYEAQMSPNNILSYRLLADFQVDTDNAPRIGLKGTAKVYGKRVSLFYYLMRRPIAYVRRALGV